MAEDVSHALKIRLREQQNFEQWISQDTSLGWRHLDGIRLENGLMDYDCVDVKNKWSGWLAARTGQHSWESP